MDSCKTIIAIKDKILKIHFIDYTSFFDFRLQKYSFFILSIKTLSKFASYAVASLGGVLCFSTPTF